MNYLQYTSKEMYSSTELIRKSKSIFEKLNKKEIEKAVILRDGKPSFMLLDFDTYEKIMEEYMSLKNSYTKIKKDEASESISKVNKLVKKEKNEEVKKDDLSEADVQKALAEIEKISFDDISTIDDEENIKIDDENSDEIFIEERPIDKNDKALKEFWE
ncbi:hypothetical protein [Arcobacter sp. CECT 8985]|uniref:hypothetical protein n=1 Tax=Arcobacter sp. CECT 8985 TaxID=1935424 RepID=UPI00100AF4A0|nr:hypothetical protein [Arcobacter sp. CECT 8985]RXJ86883.1 hypothetical protein CRU93_06685 [Arcobacter sp. CECT 8985]